MIKSSIDIPCLVLLLLWTSLAIQKFQSQPIATYVSFNKGDDGQQIKHPHVTICPLDLNVFDYSFMERITWIMKNDSNIDINEYMENEIGLVTNLISAAGNYQDELFDLSQVLSPFFQPLYGLCIGFESDKLDIKVNDGRGTYSSSFWIALNDNEWHTGNGQIFFH
jgi:hypothetical protein